MGLADVRLPRWEDIHRVLTVDENLQSVSPEQAAELVESGDFVLIDVRPQADYDKAHPAGAVNVPLFQRVNFRKPSFAGYLRAAALMANGVTPVEQNPDFVAQLAGAGPRVILACEAGGVLDPSSSFPFGKESRSLKAAFKAIRGGVVEEVLHLQGGVYGWFKADLPFVGPSTVSPTGNHIDHANIWAFTAR
ncbi:hypothetical protein WJX81_005156 [Elliptochloris bilobata]|uniref:Rhodanese domain-containing protein n=1 Tax=Elliptochloris bilobata TaxID=381761 RepID=A0AAW1RN11_9CHLO